MLTIFKKEITDKGRQRIDNQDTWICTDVWQKTPLLAVIDGVGGYAGGKEAAEIAQETIINYIQQFPGEHKRILLEAITNANNQIVEAKKKMPQFSKMSCVLSVALIDMQDQIIHFGHLGDTRIYVFRNGELTKITSDHSVIGYREEKGDLTESEAMNHIQRNEILRVLGERHRSIDEENFIETGSKEIFPDDIILLCSDGLTDMITKAQIAQILSQKFSIEKMNTVLVDAANNAGGKDNITIVLAKFEGSSRKKKLPESNIINHSTRENPIQIETEFREIQVAEVPTLSEKSQKSGTRLMAGILFGILLGIGGFWLFKNKTLLQDKPVVLIKQMRNDEKQLRAAIALNDTFSFTKDSTQISITLTKPIILKNTLFWLEKSRLILLADSNYQLPAIILEKGANVQLQNISFKNFKVGIQTEEQALVLKNVRNENVGVAIKNEIVQLPYQQNYIKISIDSLKKR